MNFTNETAIGLHVYRKGPPSKGGVGSGGSYRGGMGWVMKNIKIVGATGYLIQQIKIRSAGY